MQILSRLSERYSVETWLPVPDFEGYYDVSDRGRMLSLRKKLIMSTPPDGAGYPQINLWVNGQQKHATVHVLVLTAFNGACPAGMEARHLNDIKTDNRWPENLAWGTPVQNCGEDRLVNGISNRGERHGLHILTEPDVLEIYRRGKAGERPSALAVEFDVSRQCVNHVLSGRRWGWLTADPVKAVRAVLEGR